MADLRVIEFAVEAARAGELARLSQLLSPNFFARLANGRIIVGQSGFVEAISYSAVVAAPARAGFSDLEEVADGFVISHETSPLPSALDPGAWLLHVRDGRIDALLYFQSPDRALEAVPPHLRDLSPVQLIERAIAAANARDMPALVSVLASDFELVPVPGAPPQTGVPALLDLLESIGEHFDSYRLVPDRIEELDGGFVLVEGSVETALAGEVARAPRSILARVQNGLATGWRLFDTPEQARAAAATGPPRRIGREHV